MKNCFFLFLIFPLLFFSCLNKAQVKEEKIKKEQAIINTESEVKENTKFETSFSITNANKNNAQLHSLEYTFSFVISLPKEKVFLEYQLFDSDDILLVEGTIGKDKPKVSYSEKISFSSYFNYKNIKYKIQCKNAQEQIVKLYEGECINSHFPRDLKFEITAVNTELINEIRSVSQTFSCYVETTADVVLDKVRVIPPSKDFYWDIIPDSLDENTYRAISNIKDSTHHDYLECGIYHVQFLFGKYGLIQDTFLLKDIYGNDSGPNYGVALASVLSDDLNTIEWELQNLSLLKKMEFQLYDKNDQDSPIAVYEFPNVQMKCAKKELFQQLQNNRMTTGKIKYNKKYLYKIKLEYQTDSLETKYFSISPYYEITFYGFNLF